MTDRELLQQALDALEAWDARGRLRIIEALRTRLDKPNKEWVGLTDDDVDYFVDAIYKGFDMKPKNKVEIAYFERLIKFVGAKLEDKNT